MWFYGISGFVIGFFFGMIANGYLLRDISREQLHTNKSLRMRYGLLNWGIAFLGMIIGLALFNG